MYDIFLTIDLLKLLTIVLNYHEDKVYFVLYPYLLTPQVYLLNVALILHRIVLAFAPFNSLELSDSKF